MKTVNKIKRKYLISLICLNLFFVITIYISILKSEGDIVKLIVFLCAMLVFFNISITFSYFKTIRLQDLKIGNYKSKRKKDLMPVLVLLCAIVSGMFLIFVKGLILIGTGIIFAGAYTFIYFNNKLLKKHVDSKSGTL